MYLPAMLALLVLAPTLHAQERGPLVIPGRESFEVMLLRTSASSRCQQACVVRAAPYAAERVVERVQVLADGNRIVGHSSEQLYRDAAGRTRVESEWRDSPLVQIQDPVRNMSYRLYPADKTGLSMTIGRPAPASGAVSTVLAPAGEGAARAADRLAPALAGAAGAADIQRSVRSLGTRQMEGLTVEGTLETSTIPAGKSGNTLPIMSTTETWTAPALKLDLYVKSVDPRYGEQVTRVQNLRRGEPPARLFTPPADYTVQEIARR
jgi:hypothetical protein